MSAIIRGSEAAGTPLPARKGDYALFAVALSASLLLLSETRTPRSRDMLPAASLHRAAARQETALPAVTAQVMGEIQRDRIREGESLLAFARRHATDTVTLARLNELRGERATPGQTLLLPTQFIAPALPAGTDDAVILNVPERRVYLYVGGRLRARYPVAIGRNTWQTPTGRFAIKELVLDAVWVPPQEIVRREGTPRTAVAAGARNPLGRWWIGWTAPQVGFHSTNAPQSVGHLASHACVRMYPEHAAQLFDAGYEGMPIFSVYEPVRIGRAEGGFYLSVSPDVYGRLPSLFGEVRKRLVRAGLWARVDPVTIRQITARADGVPHAIFAAPPVHGK